jgi:single-strand selective monofunctional uracil DNA glycosylase
MSNCSTRSTAEPLIKAARRLREAVDKLTFGPPVSHVYNPLRYAWRPHELYLRTYGAGRKQVLFVGMNPGPFGMAQNGVPFGEISIVRNWLKINGTISRPEREHPRRPVAGFACHRSEVSGQRFWGLFAERFRAPKAFFSAHFVVSYCPLAFMEESGRNRTPDKLSKSEKQALFAACNEHLSAAVRILQPEWLIGIGDFAHRRITELFRDDGPKIGRILHPSPASPVANRDWPAQVTAQLVTLGVWK